MHDARRNAMQQLHLATQGKWCGTSKTEAVKKALLDFCRLGKECLLRKLYVFRQALFKREA